MGLLGGPHVWTKPYHVIVVAECCWYIPLNIPKWLVESPFFNKAPGRPCLYVKCMLRPCMLRPCTLRLWQRCTHIAQCRARSLCTTNTSSERWKDWAVGWLLNFEDNHHEISAFETENSGDKTTPSNSRAVVQPRWLQVRFRSYLILGKLLLVWLEFPGHDRPTWDAVAGYNEEKGWGHITCQAGPAGE